MFNSVELLTRQIIDYNVIINKTNIVYIHFKIDQQINLGFNSNFIKIENQLYYEDFFVNENILNIIQDSNSTDIINFNNIFNNTIYNEIYLNKAVIFYINTLSPGHELASLINSIYIYHYNKLFDFEIVVSDNIFSLGKMLISILYLFFDKKKIHVVNNLTKVNINETYIYKILSNKLNHSVIFLLDKLNNSLIINNELSVKYEKLCLIKCKSLVKFNNNISCFDNYYKSFFQINGFNTLIVEDFEIEQLYYLIHNCKYAVLSWGANSWCNSTFINKTQKIMTLCHKYYKNEYDGFKKINNIEKYYSQWTPICDKNVMVYDLNTEFNKTTNQILTDKLIELYS